MAFLSLNLNREEPQSSAEEPRLRLHQKQTRADGNANGNGAVKTEVVANATGDSGEEPREIPILNPAVEHKANGADHKSTSATAEQANADHWPEIGMEIIQSVLRQAQKKNESDSAGAPAVTSGAKSVPADEPLSAIESAENESAAEESPVLPLPREVDELRKQISQGLTPIFRTAGKENADEARTADATQIDPRLAAAQATEPEIPKPAAAEIPQALSSILEEIRKIAEADRIAVPAATTPPGDTTSAPTWMPKLSSGDESHISNVAPEVLSPVMDEIRKALGGESTISEQPGDFDVVEAKTPVPAKSDSAPMFATFKFGYLPGRGLLYSIIGHEIALFGLFLLVTYVLPTFRERRLIVGSINAQEHVIYLPEVGGGEEGQKSPGGGVSKPQQASAAPARASKGFSYPGAQAILSDPPNPTNAFQTVLHPLMVHPEPLKKLLPAPNLVQMAEMRLPSELVAPKAAMPHFQAPVVPIRVKQDSRLHRNAKFDVPVKAPQLLANTEMPKLAAAEQPVPQAPKVQPKPKQQEQTQAEEKPAPQPLKVTAEKRAQRSEKQVAPPSTAQVAKLEMHGKSLEPILSLSPAALPQGRVPVGEARGRFAIAPGGTLNPNAVTPGKPNGTASASAATGHEKSQSANAATELASNTGTGAGHNPAAGGGSGNANATSGGGSAGQGSGSGSTAGAGVGGSGIGNGRGAAGAGAGRSGQGAGTGAGAGSGAGTGSFPGITIQGGEGNEGNGDSHKFAVTQQTPYQMTIVATASSGGGLADFGVFENERVYTVYIPMQRTPEEADPTWTLQYALETPSADAANGQLVAPTPVMREWPQIPADLVKNYSQRQVVVYGILGTDGKLSHISVKQTPDVHISSPIAEALAKWVFRPAQLDNKPVPVKILLGIPLS